MQGSARGAVRRGVKRGRGRAALDAGRPSARSPAAAARRRRRLRRPKPPQTAVSPRPWPAPGPQAPAPPPWRPQAGPRPARRTDGLVPVSRRSAPRSAPRPTVNLGRHNASGGGHRRQTRRCPPRHLGARPSAPSASAGAPGRRPGTPARCLGRHGALQAAQRRGQQPGRAGAAFAGRRARQQARGQRYRRESKTGGRPACGNRVLAGRPPSCAQGASPGRLAGSASTALVHGHWPCQTSMARVGAACSRERQPRTVRNRRRPAASARGARCVPAAGERARPAASRAPPARPAAAGGQCHDPDCAPAPVDGPARRLAARRAAAVPVRGAQWAQ